MLQLAKLEERSRQMDISDVELYFPARHLAKVDCLLYWTFKLC